MELVDTTRQDVFINFTEEIINIHGVYNKIRFANHYFTLKIKQSIPWEDKFQNMLYQIYNSREFIRVKDIAQREIISEKQVTRIFNNRVGVSARTFMKIIRFQKALKMMSTKQAANLVDIALEAGYYDQSHFIRDFYQFTGTNPSAPMKKITNI